LAPAGFSVAEAEVNAWVAPVALSNVSSEDSSVHGAVCGPESVVTRIGETVIATRITVLAPDAPVRA
jgi:hypothetical protein